MEPKQINDKKIIISEVGGLFGVMSDKCVTEIFMTQNTFYWGDKIKIRLDCDNSKCTKPVFNFKAKIIRAVEAKNS